MKRKINLYQFYWIGSKRQRQVENLFKFDQGNKFLDREMMDDGELINLSFIGRKMGENVLQIFKVGEGLDIQFSYVYFYR